jgi:Ca-activated chloride channel family protein
MLTRLIFITTALLVLPIGLARGTTIADGVPSIRSSVELVLAPVTVTDRKGATVTGLQQHHFTLLEDNVPQTILSFAQQDVPCSVGVIIDTSGSVFHQLDAAKSAVRAFLETMAPRDETSLMRVSARSKVESGFTPEVAEIRKSLQFVRTGGSSELADPLYLGLSRMRSAHNPRRALLVVSYGMDNDSRYSKGELMRWAMEADVQIYTISAGVIPLYGKPTQVREEHRGLTLLEELSEKTGGLHFTVESSNQAAQAAKQVGLAIRNQYLIGYRPVDSEATTGKWHDIRVKLDIPNTKLYARNGYYSR